MKINFKYIILPAAVLICKIGNSNTVVDSLKKRISLETNGASKAILYIRLSDNYNYNYPDSMLKYAELANNLAIKSNFVKGEFLSAVNIASACYVTGEYGKGLIKAKRALEIAQKTNKNEWLARANNSLGLLYSRTNKFTEAIEFFNDAIIYLRKTNNQISLATSLNNLANCYFAIKNYKKSIEIRKQTIAMRKTLKQESGLGDCYNDLGDTYKELNKYDSAIYYLSKAYEIKQRIGDFEMCAVTTINLGVVYFELKDYSSALKYYFLSNGYALQIKSLPYRLEIWKRILKVYDAKNDVPKQLDLLYKIMVLNDSVYNEENQKQINQLHLEFQTEKKELENKSLKIKNANQVKLTTEESKRKNLVMLFSLIGGTLLVVFLLFVLNRFKITRKQKNQIENKNKDLEELNKQIQNNKAELERLSIVASETDNVVLIMDEHGVLEWVNASFEKLNAITLEELKKLKGNTIFEISNNPDIRKIVDECVKEKKSYNYESLNFTRDGKRYWESSTLTPIFNKEGKLRKLIIIDTDITERKDAEELIKEKQKEILDSIHYAKRIQIALLPSDKYIEKQLKGIKK